MPELFEDLNTRANEIARHRENSARHAQAFAKFHTSGQGSIEFPARVDFGLTFIEQPYVGYGCEIDLQALEDLLGIDSDTNDMPPLPLASGFVTAWDQDDRDFYTGCWVAVCIYFPPGTTPAVPATAMVEMEHHFTFAAIAMKDVPTINEGY